MHEMSYITRMIALATEIAEEQNIKKINEIEVHIGQTSGVKAYYMHKYFPEASKDTIVEGAKLVCVEIPVKALCEECGKEYLPNKENNYLCPHCGGRKAHIIEGKGVTLNNVVVED